MLFHAKAVLKDRNRNVVREPKPEEESNPKGVRVLPDGQKAAFHEEEQKRDVLHGYVARMALDATVDGDQKDMQADPGKWVKSVMERQELAERITASLNEGDGWVDLDKSERDLIVSRIALITPMYQLAATGPVMWALNNPPKEKPVAATDPVGNGAAVESAAA